MLKKIISLLVALIVCCAVSVLAFADAEPQVSARSAILINADDGQILFAKDENTKRPMASTTKIMTALLTLEAAAVNNKVVTITGVMVRVEGSSMGLQVGDQLCLKSLAAGMLVVSGNDAANSAAIAVSGSTKAFAELMNKRADELHMTNTHFVTPSGLDDDEHYTTAKDMATLAMAAMKNPDFAEIAGNRLMNVDYVNPDQTRRFTNHNKLLSMYDGCTGVKTGFTKKSGRCLVSAAKRNGVNLIAVTLNASDDWNDHEKLLNYGFTKLVSCSIDDSGFSCTLPVVGGNEPNVEVHGTVGSNVVIGMAESVNVKRTVELPRFIYAPVEAGQLLGVVRYTVGEKTIATTELVAAGEVTPLHENKNIFQIFMDKVKALFSI